MKWKSASVLSAHCWAVSYIENDIKQRKVSKHIIDKRNGTFSFYHFINILLSSSLNGWWVHEPRHFNHHSMRLLWILCTWVFECVISSNFPSLCDRFCEFQTYSIRTRWIAWYPSEIMKSECAVDKSGAVFFLYLHCILRSTTAVQLWMRISAWNWKWHCRKWQMN